MTKVERPGPPHRKRGETWVDGLVGRDSVRLALAIHGSVDFEIGCDKIALQREERGELWHEELVESHHKVNDSSSTHERSVDVALRQRGWEARE